MSESIRVYARSRRLAYTPPGGKEVQVRWGSRGVSAALEALLAKVPGLACTAERRRAILEEAARPPRDPRADWVRLGRPGRQYRCPHCPEAEEVDPFYPTPPALEKHAAAAHPGAPLDAAACLVVHPSPHSRLLRNLRELADFLKTDFRAEASKT